MSWEYKREETVFDIIPEGVHRVRIKDVDRAVSKNGNDMLVMQFDVSGYSGLLYYYITFMPDKPEITNRNLTQIFDSFADIKEGDTITSHWIGKVGACKVVHEEYNGEKTAKIKRFIPANKQNDLPPWKEAAGSSATQIDIPVQDLPF